MSLDVCVLWNEECDWSISGHFLEVHAQTAEDDGHSLGQRHCRAGRCPEDLSFLCGLSGSSDGSVFVASWYFGGTSSIGAWLKNFSHWAAFVDGMTIISLAKVQTCEKSFFHHLKSPAGRTDNRPKRQTSCQRRHQSFPAGQTNTVTRSHHHRSR